MTKTYAKAEALPSIVQDLIAVSPMACVIGRIKERWHVSDRTAARWVHDARMVIKRQSPMPDIPALQAEHIARREALYQQAEDPAVKLKILQDIARIQGLYIDRQDIRVTRIDVKDDDIVSILSPMPIDYKPEHITDSQDNVYTNKPIDYSPPDFPGAGVGEN